MTYLQRIAFLFAALACSSYMEAQDRRAILHLSQPFYAAGDTIWYALYLPEEALPVRAFLKDRQGQVLQTHFAAAQQGKAVGYFPLPVDLPGAAYQLQWTAFDQNQTVVSVLEHELPVLNDLLALPEKIETALADTLPPGEDLQITAQFTAPAGNSAFPLQIRVSDRAGRPVAATVSLQISDDPLFQQHSSVIRGKPLPPLFHTNGFPLSGRVTHPQGQPRPMPLLALVVLETDSVFYCSTDSAGRFVWIMPPFYGPRTLQCLDPLGGELDIVWDQPESATVQREHWPIETFVPYWESGQHRKKIRQVFGIVPMPAPAPAVRAEKKWKTKRSYQVQDYERFPDMATFFTEVATIVKFRRGNDGGYQVRMYDPENNRDFETPPLFVVDGQYTMDAGFVAALPPEQIASVEVLYGLKLLQKHYRSLGAGGVVRIQSLQGRLALPPSRSNDLFRIHGCLPEMRHSGPVAGSPAPQLFPLLCWIPDITLPEQGAHVQVSGSHDRSTYRITLVARSAQGRTGTRAFRYQAR